MTWKSLPGFDGKYEVSSEGEVRSTRHYSVQRLKTKKARPDKDGYLRVQLCGANSKMLTRHVHRLVTETFIGPMPEGMQVCHNNGDKTDNRVENLRYGTPKENARDRAAHGTETRGERSGPFVLSTEDVVAMRKAYVPGEVSYKEIARLFNTCPANAWLVVNNRTWKEIA